MWFFIVSAKLTIFIGYSNIFMAEKPFSAAFSAWKPLVNKNNTHEPCGTKKILIFAGNIDKCFFQFYFKNNYGKLQGFRSREHPRDVC